tara:strand:+ start:552 stop:1052 length:501 start_codon:yes stop_codon:yes gene_type:complete
MNELYYKGLIGIRDEAFVQAADKIRAELRGSATLAIDNPHMTLLLPSQLKAVKEVHGFSNKEAKTFVKSVVNGEHLIPSGFCNPLFAPPPVDTSLLVQRADRGDKHTYFLRVINQDEWQEYLDVLTDLLGIDRVERYFHVSIANNTGKPTDSIADICADDCVGVNA